jgi:methylmalonyl-CoA epimerase
MPDKHVLQLDHLGIAVSDIEAALKLYRDVLGLAYVAAEEIPDQGIRSHHLKLGEAEIELLEPTDPEGPVGKFLSKRGPGIHHMALRVTNLDLVSRKMTEAGFKRIGDPSTGAGGKSILFFHPGSTGGVLLELCETGQRD